MPRKVYGTVKDYTSGVGRMDSDELSRLKRYYELRADEGGSLAHNRQYWTIVGEMMKRGLIAGGGARPRANDDFTQ